jgi:transcriptional regulator with PAS, ATPase and Fis domain
MRRCLQAIKTTKDILRRPMEGLYSSTKLGRQPSLQIRLLRCLQEKEVIRVGGTKSSTIDVRMSWPPIKIFKKKVQRRFRKDLFYRINVIKIVYLAEEKKTSLLANYLSKYCSSMNKKKTIHPKALT